MNARLAVLAVVLMMCVQTLAKKEQYLALLREGATMEQLIAARDECNENGIEASEMVIGTTFKALKLVCDRETAQKLKERHAFIEEIEEDAEVRAFDDVHEPL